MFLAPVVIWMISDSFEDYSGWEEDGSFSPVLSKEELRGEMWIFDFEWW